VGASGGTHADETYIRNSGL